MKDFKLTRTHDLAVEDDDFQMIGGLPEIAQSCEIALLTIRYEYWLDGLIGVPWNHGMFWPWTSEEERKLYLKQALFSVEGVTSVRELVYSEDTENRSALIEVANIETVEGIITGIGVS